MIQTPSLRSSLTSASDLLLPELVGSLLAVADCSSRSAPGASACSGLVSALQPRHAGEDRPGAGVAQGTERNILSCRAALQPSADLSQDMVCHPLQCQTRVGQVCARRRGILGSAKQFQVFNKVCANCVSYSIWRSIRNWDPTSYEASSSSFFLPYTLFPQVFSPEVRETRVFQLNYRTPLKMTFF